MTAVNPHIGAVVIGRNEGARLTHGLDVLRGQLSNIVYVDSGSSDGSVPAAKALDVTVIELDLDQPFTAARARNAGLEALRDSPDVRYVQFLDGDCEMQPGWIPAALAFLEEHADAAVVCGRRRERHPDASVYNRLIDLEWDTQVGQARACGGDAMMRLKALDAVGGYRDSMIAGEEPELCVRLRAAGWAVWRLDAEMTLHDAAMTHFGQWWRRARRAGHAYAEGAALHGAPPERHNVAAVRRALLWGLGVPVLALVACSLLGGWGALILLAWPLQVLRLWARSRDLAQGAFLTLVKLPESLGILQYYRARVTGRHMGIIEYK